MAPLMAADSTCLAGWCQAPEPRHAIVWKCPAGHRKTCWYCSECIHRMMRVAAAASAGQALDGVIYGQPVCDVCDLLAALVSELPASLRDPGS